MKNKYLTFSLKYSYYEFSNSYGIYGASVEIKRAKAPPGARLGVR